MIKNLILLTCQGFFSSYQILELDTLKKDKFTILYTMQIANIAINILLRVCTASGILFRVNWVYLCNRIYIQMIVKTNWVIIFVDINFLILPVGKQQVNIRYCETKRSLESAIIINYFKRLRLSTEISFASPIYPPICYLWVDN